MTLLNLTLILFLLMDPLGHLAVYRKFVRGKDQRHELKFLFREMGFALIAILLFNFLGEFIFNFFQLSEVTVRFSAGVIILLAALKILFPKIDSPRMNLPKEEPYLIPFAIPFIAGPGLLATVMLFAHMEESAAMMLTAIFIAWIAALAVFLLSKPLHRILGDNGLMAIERLMGMLLVLLAIQHITEGFQLFLAQHGIGTH